MQRRCRFRRRAVLGRLRLTLWATTLCYVLCTPQHKAFSSEATRPDQKLYIKGQQNPAPPSPGKILHWLCLFAAFFSFSSSFPSSWVLTSQASQETRTGQGFQAKRHLYAGHLWPHGSKRGPLPHVAFVTAHCLCTELHYIVRATDVPTSGIWAAHPSADTRKLTCT